LPDKASVPFAVVAVVIPEVLPPMGKKYFQLTHSTTEQRKKRCQRERHSQNTTATTALSLLFLYNYLKTKN
jgi:hypothetical protein